MKSFVKLFIFAAALTTLACSQSPTNTQSNPLRKYDGLQNDLSPDKAQKDKVLPAETDDGEPTACPKAYAMTIRDAQGQDAGRNLAFTVGESKTYQIGMTPDMAVSLVNPPKGVSLQKKSAGSWLLSFKPDSSQGNLNDRMVLSVAVPQTGCIKGAQGEPVQVAVNTGKAQPTISVLSLNQRSLYQSTDIINFQIQVVDPNLADSEAAQSPQFEFDNGFLTGETLFVSAKDAVSCNRSTKVADKTYRFSCLVDANQIKMTFSGQEFGHTTFKIFDRSVNGSESRHQEVELHLQYPKSAAPAVAAPAAPATPTPATKPAPKSKTASKDTSASKSKKNSGDNT